MPLSWYCSFCGRFIPEEVQVYGPRSQPLCQRCWLRGFEGPPHRDRQPAPAGTTQTSFLDPVGRVAGETDELRGGSTDAD